MSTATITIGPEHDGQKMSLDEFAAAEGSEGHLYELSRGVVTVIDVPNRPHLRRVSAAMQQLFDYKSAHPGAIDTIATGSECKILLEDAGSERHPDLAVYKTAPPDIATGELWSVWVPELVIEVVSPDSRHRDYDEKPDEYLQFGVAEYGIIDAEQNEMTVLQRKRGVWEKQTVRPGKTYSTHLLPALKFDLQAVFEAAKS